MKDRRIRYEAIEFAIADNGKLYILGHEPELYFRDLYFYMVCSASTGEILEENNFKRLMGLSEGKKDKEYLNRKERLERFYIKRLTESVKNIKVYQGSIDEVSKDLGEELERVDTGKPETFIRVPDDKNKDLLLRVKAKELGADAIVHYQPESFVGTPVRFVDKKRKTSKKS